MRFARARRIRKFGTRNDAARAREASVGGGAKAELKYSRPRAYRTAAEALTHIRGTRETNQSSTTSVRSSRRTSPSSANVRATRMRDISSQTTRARIGSARGAKEKKFLDARGCPWSHLSREGGSSCDPPDLPGGTQKGIIPTPRWARRGGSQARTTAPDLRSGLAGVRGFKSLALRAGRKVPSPAPSPSRPSEFSENLYVREPARRGSEEGNQWLSSRRLCCSWRSDYPSWPWPGPLRSPRPPRRV